MSSGNIQAETFFYDEKTDRTIPLFELNNNLTHKTRVSYHRNADTANYHYGPFHPMKPFRLRLTDNLVTGYGLHNVMDLYEVDLEQNHNINMLEDKILKFHSKEYLNFLKNLNDNSDQENKKYLVKKDIDDNDCPIFHGLYKYCLNYTSTTLSAVECIKQNKSDIAINWSGGLHHAKKFKPSGFCYLNDIVIGILDLLKTHARVLYIDIDIHHGDGVQEAFYLTDRVFTISFHKYGGYFFPMTGALQETGVAKGKNYCLNVPLMDGIKDFEYTQLFKSIITPLVESYNPECIVLQCGTDSLGYDRLGTFNLTVKGHGECVKYVKSLGVPLVLLGGGGYTPPNVSRAWCYETGIANDLILREKLPDNLPFKDYYSPDYSLYPELGDSILTDLNSKTFLNDTRIRLLEQIRYLQGAPSVRMDNEYIPSKDIQEIMMYLKRPDKEVLEYDDICNTDYEKNDKVLENERILQMLKEDSRAGCL
ncbi:hypothetical protein ACO0OL_003075 [Hanseniaspora opuntiae]|jgi:histone deacetylase HOS2